jgi:uncharacterized membrane protein
MDTTTPPLADTPGTAPSSTPPPAASSGTPPPVAATEDKTAAIVSYLTFFGFIAAIIIHSNKKTALGAFHLRQTLGIFLTAIAVGICEVPVLIIPILGLLCVLAIWFGMFVLWVMGLISAINGSMKPVPIVGPMYQKWFAGAFK